MRLHSSNNLRYPFAPKDTQQGAVLLVMLTILIMGSSYLFVSNLNNQSSNSKQNQFASARLVEIRNALLGYAVANGRLPCPDTNGDGLQNGPNCNAVEGGVPWLDLGIPYRDTWGHSIRYRADDNYTGAAPITSNTISGLRIETISGTQLSLNNPNAPAAIIFSCGTDGIPNDKNDADGNTNTNSVCANPGVADNIYVKDAMQATFDDILLSISKNDISSRMVSAGQWL